jgi:hypothetical protein
MRDKVVQEEMKDIEAMTTTKTTVIIAPATKTVMTGQIVPGGLREVEEAAAAAAEEAAAVAAEGVEAEMTAEDAAEEVLLRIMARAALLDVPCDLSVLCVTFADILKMPTFQWCQLTTLFLWTPRTLLQKNALRLLRQRWTSSWLKCGRRKKLLTSWTNASDLLEC